MHIRGFTTPLIERLASAVSGAIQSKRMRTDAPGFLYARVAIAHVQGESLKAIAPLLNETVVNTRAPRTTLGRFSCSLKKERLMTNKNLIKMLASIPNAREDIIQELRDMAAAKDKYNSFMFVPIWVKDTWLIAAELLERDIRDMKEPAPPMTE